MEKVFAVKFYCHNCGHSWWEEFCKGDKIHDGILSIKAPYVEDHRCTHSTDCPYCHTIKCPVCSADEEVSVEERKPLLWSEGEK